MIRFELGNQICVCLSDSDISLELNNTRHSSLSISQNEYLILSIISCYGTLNAPISQRCIERKISQHHNVTLPENGFKNIVASLRKKFKQLTKSHLDSRQNVIENIHRIGYFVPFKSHDNQQNGVQQQLKISKTSKHTIRYAIALCLTDKKLYTDLGLTLAVASFIFFAVCYYAISSILNQGYFGDVEDFTDALSEQSCFSDPNTLKSLFDDAELIESSMMIDKFNIYCLITADSVMPVSRVQYDEWFKNSSYTTHSMEKNNTKMTVRVRNINLYRSIDSYISTMFLAGMKVCTNTGNSFNIGSTDGKVFVSKEQGDGFKEFFYVSNPIKNILLFTAMLIIIIRYKRLLALIQYFWAIRRFNLKLEPIYDTTSHQNIHYEALSRFSVSNTQKFIETLIANKLLLLHTLLVIRIIFSTSKALIAPLSINVCPSLLRGKRFSVLYEELKQYDCSYLTVEITENASMYYTNEIYQNITRLKTLGCSISIDDFGTGNNNVELISKIKPDYLKIDREFVIGLKKDNKRIETLRQLIAMGKANQCKVIVEGVESADCAHLLTTLGAHIHQGFYYSLS
ncbi:EAL domain-containing protein [Vibrio coralliilyticus]|uniref:cyclic di-GMP phosphodiesterase TpdA n=1 Tax=Vibrio TaxID=662 RepID=UPI000508C5D2|nr:MULTISPECIES: EAL domain-containing protein [Vibrio]KFI10784.1 diguanylate cyclase [Vibrio sp. B183]NOI19971.1 EAL domain-containing protein [Vibrio coralliilyticus]